MDQLILFDPARARRRDPKTSHLAAERLNAIRQTGAIFDCLCRNPGVTASELARITGIDSCHKRLPELRARGMVQNGPSRVCEVTGFEAQTWFPLRVA